jgi:beta-phosphoglucomutase-like phosphatase (HAD superfamily)
MRLGLPAKIRACLFDLDGVITETARLHARAWKEVFDAFLSRSASLAHAAFVPFDPVRDYELYVDGKPRDDGARAFLASRGVKLPEGADDDLATMNTVKELGKRENDILLGLLHTEGVEAYSGSIRYVRAVKLSGLRMAVVSSSKNRHDVLAAAGIAELFDLRVDGVVALGRQAWSGHPSRRGRSARRDCCAGGRIRRRAGRRRIRTPGNSALLSASTGPGKQRGFAVTAPISSSLIWPCC